MKRIFITLIVVLLGVFASAQERIQLLWDASTDNVGVEGYRVWIDGEAIGTTPDTFYIMDLDPGKLDLTVSAFDAAGNESAQSYPLNITINDILPPSIPNNLTIQFLETTSLELEWDDSYDNYRMSGYNVYVDGELFQFTSGSSLLIESLTPETDYKMDVSALDRAGNESARSAPIYATTTAIIIPPEERDSLTMRVYPNPSYGHFKVLLDNGKIPNNTKIQIVNTAGQIVYERMLSYGLTPPYEEDFNLMYLLETGSYFVTLIVQNKRVGYSQLIISKPRSYNL